MNPAPPVMTTFFISAIPRPCLVHRSGRRAEACRPARSFAQPYPFRRDSRFRERGFSLHPCPCSPRSWRFAPRAPPGVPAFSKAFAGAALQCCIDMFHHVAGSMAPRTPGREGARRGRRTCPPSVSVARAAIRRVGPGLGGGRAPRQGGSGCRAVLTSFASSEGPARLTPGLSDEKRLCCQPASSVSVPAPPPRVMYVKCAQCG
jgi:hypothetical protein